VIREICFIGTPITEGAFCSAAIARPVSVLLRRFPPSWKVQIARKSAAIDPTASNKQDDLKLTVECPLCRPAVCGVRCAERTGGKSLADDDLDILAVWF
jgi:hypothetical protein